MGDGFKGFWGFRPWRVSFGHISKGLLTAN